jgi:hypothetical protein
LAIGRPRSRRSRRTSSSVRNSRLSRCQREAGRALLVDVGHQPRPGPPAAAVSPTTTSTPPTWRVTRISPSSRM